MKRFLCNLALAWLILPPFGYCADPPAPAIPDIWIPIPPPINPPPPVPQPTNAVTVPVGSFMPLYVTVVDATGKPVPTRIRLSDPTVFAAKRLKLAKGATIVGTLFTATEPDVFTMAADGYVFAAIKSGTTTLTVDANSDNGPVDKLSVTITVGNPAPPVPPTPSDPFTAALQTAYNADTGTDKAASLAFLQGVYKGLAAAPATVNTVADGLAWMKLAVEQSPKNAGGLTPIQLAGVRKAIATDLSTAWSTGFTQTTFATELNKVYNALSGVR